jgi:hypothetical protein
MDIFSPGTVIEPEITLNQRYHVGGSLSGQYALHDVFMFRIPLGFFFEDPRARL